MNLLEALGLGALQGATEFLPISSSGHLKLGEHLLGMHEPQLLFDVVLHVGTLISVIAFYRRDVLMVLRDMLAGLLSLRDEAPDLRGRLLRAFEPEGMRLALLVVLATLPTGVIGLLLKRVLDPDTGPSPITPQLVCGILILNGFILMANLPLQRREARGESPTRTGPLTLWHIAPWTALLIGVMQGIAVLPGISRSGMTITVALLLGVERLNAARYSFLLSIPAILGALVLQLNSKLLSNTTDLGIFLAGALCAGAVGYGCLILLTRMLQRAHFHWFAVYCWIIGAAGLALL